MTPAQEQMKLDMVGNNGKNTEAPEKETTLNINDYQVGGNHYRKEYQHWDMVTHTDMHYLFGCATKYIIRWRDKNGIQDLEKSIHYIEKAISQGIVILPNRSDEKLFEFFANQLDKEERDIFLLICNGDCEKAIKLIKELIASEKQTYESYIKG